MPDVRMLVGEIGGTRCFPRVALESALDPYKSYHICQKKDLPKNSFYNLEVHAQKKNAEREVARRL